jgi:hypothetical protein
MNSFVAFLQGHSCGRRESFQIAFSQSARLTHSLLLVARALAHSHSLTVSLLSRDVDMRSLTHADARSLTHLGPPIRRLAPHGLVVKEMLEVVRLERFSQSVSQSVSRTVSQPVCRSQSADSQTHPPTHSLVHSLTHSLAHSLTHSLAQSLTHLLTD